MKTENTATGVALALGSLSLTDQVTFFLGLVAIVFALVANWLAIRRNKVQKELAEYQLEKEKNNE